MSVSNDSADDTKCGGLIISTMTLPYQFNHISFANTVYSHLQDNLLESCTNTH